jgi:hypothetical protein
VTTHLLIDADYEIRKAAEAAQSNIDWGDGVTTAHADLERAQHIVWNSVSKITQKVEWFCDDTPRVHMCFSCPTRRYFRHDIDPEYKSHRRGGVSPMLLGNLREYCETVFTTWTRPNLEADDVLGILATRDKPIKMIGTKVICSIDKDLEQIPGFHINPKKLDNGVYEVSPKEAVRNLHMQVLMGDSTDGYKGCPGVGKVTAQKILDSSCDTPFMAIWAAYKKAKCTKEYFEQQWNLARILQSDCYDFNNKEPILWRME